MILSRIACVGKTLYEEEMTPRTETERQSTVGPSVRPIICRSRYGVK